MNEILTFDNNELGNVRSTIIDGQVWFVGKDICTIFGDSNHNRSLGRIDDEDRKTLEITDSYGRSQNAVFINEAGLYSLLFAMQPQKANKGEVQDAYPTEVQLRIEKLKKFKRWVTHEVLPSIRKMGSYSTNTMSKDNVSDLINVTNNLIAQNSIILEQNSKLLSLLTNNATAANVGNDNVKYDCATYSYMNQVESAVYPVTTALIASDYGLSARKLNAILSDNGVQSKRNGHWLLNDEYKDKNYMVALSYTNKKGVVNINTKWTKQGRLFIYCFLRELNILPICER